MKQILIADDDRFMANVCRQKFEEAGFQVAVAHDGHAAIEQLVLHPPDVVLLDLVLPEIDGVGVLRFLRSNEKVRGVPVIVVSNSSYFSGMVQAAWQAGATHFVNKADCSPKSLVDEVLKVLSPEPAALSEPEPLPRAQTNYAAKSPSAPMAPRVESPQPLRPPQRKPGSAARVLVADDDRVIHGVLNFFLTEAGFIVTPAMNGRQALELAEAKPPDLLVLDRMMPELDGFEVLKRWQKTPSLAHIPVIMLTAEKDEARMAEALKSGAVAYLTKPFSPDDLVKRAIHLTGFNGS